MKKQTTVLLSALALMSALSMPAHAFKCSCPCCPCHWFEKKPAVVAPAKTEAAPVVKEEAKKEVPVAVKETAPAAKPACPCVNKTTAKPAVKPACPCAKPAVKPACPCTKKPVKK